MSAEKEREPAVSLASTSTETVFNASAYQHATIYAQWGERAKALEWLDTAMRSRDPGLDSLKTDQLMDPLRNEPRFQAVMRDLSFPN